MIKVFTLTVCLKFAMAAVVDSKLDPSNKETWQAFITPPVTPYIKFTFFEVQVGFHKKAVIFCEFFNREES